MAYQYLFGPVPSRRLGISLGIDLVPHKICSLNCVYCECGSTTKLTTERLEYAPYKDVIEELNDFLIANPYPDYITFSGSGEPTLNIRIGDIIRYIKRNFSRIPLAVLTNGALLSDPDVRKELLDADIVLPSLDAGTPSAFSKINRPHVALDIETYIQGLIDFKEMFSGEIWLEIFILPGYNDDPMNLNALADAIRIIQPHRIQLNTLDRPGAVPGLQPADVSLLKRILQDWKLPNCEIIASVSTRKQKKSFRKDIEQAIFETIARRPCTLEDLTRILNLHVNEINKYLDTLESDNRIESISIKRGTFYQLKRD